MGDKFSQHRPRCCLDSLSVPSKSRAICYKWSIHSLKHLWLNYNWFSLVSPDTVVLTNVELWKSYTSVIWPRVPARNVIALRWTRLPTFTACSGVCCSLLKVDIKMMNDFDVNTVNTSTQWTPLAVFRCTVEQCAVDVLEIQADCTPGPAFLSNAVSCC